MAKKPAAQKMVAARSVFDAKTKAKFDEVLAAVRAQGPELLKIPGVIRVRAGYLFQDGWITRQPAVVVVVDPRTPHVRGAGPGEIPTMLGEVPVDVAEASPADQVIADQGADAGTRALAPLPASSTPDLALPAWESVEEPAATRALVAEVRALHKAVVPYVPPKGVKLTPVTGAMTLTCHSSPDAGWTTLGPFLAGVQKNLTVAMYDFTAPHILKGLIKDMKQAKGVLKLNLDPGIALSAGGGDESDNPKAGDITEDKVRDDLSKALGKRFDFTWAAVKRAGKTTAGIFPSAYHIKVAVRDGTAFWLSSGNWQSSNQPDVKRPTDASGIKKLFATFNREWHVLVENPQLAKVYEAFIESDIEETTPLQDGAAARALEPPQPDLLVPIEELEAVPRGALRFFEPQVFKFTARKPVTIQPVLTPDNYADVVLKLIESAKETLLFQNQYIHINKQNADGFMKLVKGLLKKVKAGLDVRIILRSIGDTRSMLEALQAQGFPPEVIRLQANCHNKGILVDGKVVAVGSHNWSSDGTTANRDATLIIESPEVATFYQQIFEFDWANLAHQKVARQRQILVAPRGLKSTPAGMVRIPWASYFEE